MFLLFILITIKNIRTYFTLKGKWNVNSKKKITIPHRINVRLFENSITNKSMAYKNIYKLIKRFSHIIYG